MVTKEITTVRGLLALYDAEDNVIDTEQLRKELNEFSKEQLVSHILSDLGPSGVDDDEEEDY